MVWKAAQGMMLRFQKEVDLIKKEAFTLLEILIVMVVMGAVATIIAPLLRFKEPAAEFPAILREFNDLVSITRQEAIVNQKNYRITFKTNVEEPDIVKIETEFYDSEKPDKKIYKQVDSEYLQTRYDLPKSIKMKAAYKTKKNEFDENKGQAFCYIIPNGLVESIMIHITKTIDDREIGATFKMESFKGEFEFIQGYLRPEK